MTFDGFEPDCVFDAVIIGGGHNGQILSAYLTKAGLNTLVVEKRIEPGGGLCTEEVTVPGFYHNLHSFFLRWVPDLPWYRDLGLERYGVRMLMPEVQAVAPFSDGSCLTFHRDQEKTFRSISKFSSKDAKSYRGLLNRFRRINEKIIAVETYAPPLDFGEKQALLEKTELGREYLALSEKSPLQLINDFFQSEQMKAMLVFLVSTRMFLLDEPGLGYNFASAVTGGLRGGMCKGGSHYLAHGISAFIETHGGKVREASHVREIVVNDNRAVGVILDDGTKIRADKLVASSVDVVQTFLDLVGEDKLERDLVDKTKAFKFSKWGLFGVHLALNEPIQYRSARFDPVINKGLNHNVGLESVADFFDHLLQIEKGYPPEKPGMQCAQPSIHDPSQAPPGKHTAFLWQFAPYELTDGGPEAWDRIKKRYENVCLDRWRQYAPNLDSKNIIATYTLTPLDVERKLINMRFGDHCMGRATRDQMLENRPFPGLAPYKSPIERLYLCGSASHPFGNITGGPGYNAAYAICKDLDIPIWWDPPDPRSLWVRL